MVEARTVKSTLSTWVAGPGQRKGAFAEAETNLIFVCRWADGEYPADCHRNVERYHRLIGFAECLFSDFQEP